MILQVYNSVASKPKPAPKKEEKPATTEQKAPESNATE